MAYWREQIDLWKQCVLLYGLHDALDAFEAEWLKRHSGQYHRWHLPDEMVTTDIERFAWRIFMQTIEEFFGKEYVSDMVFAMAGGLEVVIRGTVAYDDLLAQCGGDESLFVTVDGSLTQARL